MNGVKVLLCLVVVVAAAGYVFAQEEAEEIKPQTTCPVMGGKIDKKLYADHYGKRVYFCCPMCTKKFKNGPEKYIKKLEDQGITVERVQTLCPIMNKKIKRKLYVDHDEKRIYFCCAMCVSKFKKNPEDSLEKFRKKGLVFEDIPDKSNKHEKESHHGSGSK